MSVCNAVHNINCLANRMLNCFASHDIFTQVEVLRSIFDYFIEINFPTLSEPEVCS